MDPKKLAQLRKTFAHDVPAPRPTEPGAPPFWGIPTLLSARGDADAVPEGRLSAYDIALIGVPMDLGVTNRAGARFGPRALRAIERTGPYHHQHKIDLLTAKRLADVGDVPFRSRFDLAMCHEDIEAFFAKFAAAGVRTVAVGGDHSVTLPILKALGAKRPLGLIHFDAHCDTEAAIEGVKFTHAGPFREAVLAGVLDPDRTIQIGIRGAAEPCWEFSYASGMTVIHAEEIATLGVAGVVERARRVVGDAPCYVSFDVDGLDPCYAPGTGTPEPGGMTMREAIDMLVGLAGLNIIGGDVVEIAPAYDSGSVTALSGAQLLFEIACLAALSPQR